MNWIIQKEEVEVLVAQETNTYYYIIYNIDIVEVVYIDYNIVKKIYDILLKDKLITKEEYNKLIDKLHREC